MSRRFAAAGVIWIMLIVQLADLVSASHGNAAEVFERTWSRPDLPVLAGEVQRTWIWGPEPTTDVIHESYAESDGGQRSVQYYDKSRMEVTFTDGDQNSIWYVTNGLLVIELMTGRLQLGDNTFEARSPAAVNVAGDASDPSGPTYATMAAVRDETAENPGSLIVQRINRSGTVSVDDSLAGQDIRAATVVAETNHSVAQPFWDFMNSSGVVSVGNSFVADLLFQNPFFVTGLPVTEAYWANVQVGGVAKLVLLQCFERRCLTYTPENEPQWRVEAGNVGSHYHSWRYGSSPVDPPAADCTPGSGPNFAGQSLVQPSFISQDIGCAVFVGANIAQGNFSEADARRADFSNSDLAQPVFRNTNLDHAVFVSANLAQPQFEGTLATNADFSNALLSQPVFVNANLLGANLASAEFAGPTFINTICPDGSNSDESGGTCLGGFDDPGDPPGDDCAPGSGPDFSNQDLVQPVFTGQGLMCADFTDASVAQGDFTGVNASLAVFTRANLAQPEFQNTNLSQATFIDAELAQPTFESTNAMFVDFSGATFAQPVFDGANLLGSDMQTATIVMPTFVDTTCPDSTNSDDNGGTCIGHLAPIPPPVE